MSNLLNQLKQHSLIVADTGDFESIRKYQPRDSTTNPSLLLKAVELPEYKDLVKTKLTIPDAFRYGPVDQPKWGRILAFGGACKRTTPYRLGLGDRVLYGKFSWAKLPLGNGKHYAIVREADLLAVDAEAP